MDTVLTLPPSMTLDPAFEAAVLLVNGQEQVARDVVARGLRHSPEWPVRELALVLIANDLDTPGALAAVDRWAHECLTRGGEDPAAPGLVGRLLDALLGIRL